MAASQRKFAIMGENLFNILNKLISNQKLCRLVKYLKPNPFDTELPNVDGTKLIHENFIIIPKIPETDNEERAYIIVVFDKYVINPANQDFKISTIRFDVVCPFTEWVVDEGSLRPYLIMQEIDNMFNGSQMNGLGKLQFSHSEPLVLSPQEGGYTMYYTINEFN